jgi:hypothetical protein
MVTTLRLEYAGDQITGARKGADHKGERVSQHPGAIQETIGQAHEALAGVVPYLDAAKWGLLAVTLIGIGVMPCWPRFSEAQQERWRRCVAFRSESFCERNVPGGRPPGASGGLWGDENDYPEYRRRDP